MTKLVEHRGGPVCYISKVSVSDKIFFLRLLFRWKGSVWQTLWIDLLVFVLLYICINIFYACFLKQPVNESHRLTFEAFTDHVRKIATSTPLSMLLGFFVTAVLARWWKVAMKIPTTLTAAAHLQTYMRPKGRQAEAQQVQLTILRYMNLAWILGMRPICRQISKRFKMTKESRVQQIKHTVDGIIRKRQSMDERLERLQRINEDNCVKEHFGSLITVEEMKILIRVRDESAIRTFEDFWIPLQWCNRILSKARETGIIGSDFSFRELVHAVDDFRDSLDVLQTYDMINIPLVYTQVMIIAVYAFFLAEIFSSQVIKPQSGISTLHAYVGNTTHIYAPPKGIGNYVPIFSIFKFIFFMGWFKTAASLLNPLGNDEEALPTSVMLDENLSISIQSGGATDELYPNALKFDGDATHQLSLLVPQPNLEEKSVTEIPMDPK